MRRLAALSIALAVCCLVAAAALFFAGRPGGEAPPLATPSPAASAAQPPSLSPAPASTPGPSPTPTPSPAPEGVAWPPLDAPFALEGLDTTRQGWGQGVRVNEKNQPEAAVIYNERYGLYGGVFLAPEAESPTVYLTFDFGYETGYSAAILDTLAEKGCPATFFVVGSYARQYPDTIRRMLEEGHTVGSHSYSHKDMTALTPEQAKEEIAAFDREFAESFGQTPTVFRFPEGVFSQQLLALAANEGKRSVFWSYAYADWSADDQPPVAESLEKALAAAHPGAVYLLHPMATNSSLLGDLIDGLRAAGYTLAAL